VILSGILLQADGGTNLISFLPFVLIIVIIYFLMIRPQQKKQKERNAMLDAIRVGDEIITNGGIHGKIVTLKDKTIILKISENTKVVLDRSSVSGLRIKSN